MSELLTMGGLSFSLLRREASGKCFLQRYTLLGKRILSAVKKPIDTAFFLVLFMVGYFVALFCSAACASVKEQQLHFLSLA